MTHKNQLIQNSEPNQKLLMKIPKIPKQQYQAQQNNLNITPNLQKDNKIHNNNCP